ncbi:MAG: hypothetical protein ACLFWB_13750 [Armatimonadota bacterium]
MSAENELCVPQAIVDAILEGSLVQTRLLIALLKYCEAHDIDHSSLIELSLTQLSDRCNMHRQSVIRAIHEAEQNGRLRVDHDSAGNTYRLNIPHT